MNTIDNLSDLEIEQLISGNAKLIFSSLTNSKDEEVAKSMVYPEEMISRLSECTTREEARTVLSTLTNKEALTAIAKSLKLHIVKYDRREDIENKLIEFLIGSKLRKDAINSLNMTGGSENS